MENNQPDNESAVQLEKARSTGVCRKQISDQRFYMKSISVGDLHENNKRLRTITSMLIRVRMLRGDKDELTN